LEVAAGVIKGITELEKGNVSDTGQIEQMAKNEGEPNVIIEKMEDYKNEIDSKLMDGTEVKIMSKGDALSVGDLVMVKDAEGKFVKAPEGKHELEGGLTLYVDAEGFINELETAETDKTTESDEMRRMFEALEQLTSVVTNLKEKFESVEKTNSTLTERFEKFAAEPSTTSVSTPKKELSRTATKQERAKYFGSI
jgi:hypothetical protein